MTFEEFRSSLSQNQPPAQLNTALQALWYDGKGDWDQAHHLADSEHQTDCNWVHAYLHRKEGDKWNANYWYQRAGKTMPASSLKEEWEALVGALLR
jgi:hypothetical protein